MYNKVILPSSFRDPSGYVYTLREEIYRDVDFSYQSNYELLMSSGLYDALLSKGLLIPHEERPSTDDVYKTLKPEKLGFISYPYEWCFSQLKDAAKLTLDIQKIALDYGMSLKDATAYNVQFHKGRPIFIDTLSFQKYTEGEPWIAYEQFCRHFLPTSAY